MRISVVHSTIYRYDHPVFQEPHTFRLRPRSDGSQNLLRFDLQISPEPAGYTECLDQDGNVITETWFNSTFEQLSVRSAFEIETLRENPFDFQLNSEFASLPLALPPILESPLAPYLGPAAEPVHDLARTVAAESGSKTLPFLTALNRRIFDSLGHIVRDFGPPHPPEITLAEREGSCRDLAILFCAAARTVGIPARFVSGYECEAAQHEKAHMHAWAEVFLPGGGWRGYDPSQGLATYTAHVAVAAAADPKLAAPVSGSYRGSAQAHMDFVIEMHVE